LGSLGLPISKVVFVQKQASSTRDALVRLGREKAATAGQKPFLAVVVEGATAGEIEELREGWHVDFALLPDQNGDVTRQAGVRVSPTTVTIDSMGKVADIQMGVE
jgi:hypothetical protein